MIHDVFIIHRKKRESFYRKKAEKERLKEELKALQRPPKPEKPPVHDGPITRTMALAQQAAANPAPPPPPIEMKPVKSAVSIHGPSSHRDETCQICCKYTWPFLP